MAKGLLSSILNNKKDWAAVSDVVHTCLVNSALGDDVPPVFPMLCPTSSSLCPMLGKRIEE